MTLDGWLSLAKSDSVRNRIATEEGLDDFQAIIRVVARRSVLDWDEVVSIIHMVYGWMPTMLRPTVKHSESEKDRLIKVLKVVKQGGFLNSTQLSWVQRFSNRSIVGASKMLHALNPTNYVIWDSRVAEVFMWQGVTQATYSTLERYVEYLETLREWVKNPLVVEQCSEIRKLKSELTDASDLRIIELVLFRGKV
jgi:hypothetical protein